MRSGADPTPGEINRVVQSHLRIHKHTQEKSGPHVIADCPFCGKEKHFYVNTESGQWDCKRCNESGGFWRLADHIGVRVRSATMVRSPMSVMMASRNNAAGGPQVQAPKPLTDGPGLDMARITQACERLFAETPDEAAVGVLAYLRKRGFNDDTIRRFKLGVASIVDTEDGKTVREPAVGIPYMENGKVPLLKMRNLATEKDKRKFRRTKGSDSRLFNADAIVGARRVVLVEGELDAISMHQAGITMVASTSLGAKKTIPAEWLALLQEVEEIVLWYDADDAGQESVHALTHELGSWRVKLASIDEKLAADVQRKTGSRPKDVNDLLKAGVDAATIRGVVEAALPIDNTLIVTADRYADPLAAVIDKAEESLGAPTGLETLQRTIRGWRHPELVVVTGHTSHGKSTWVQDRLEWMAEQGEPVLLSALENGPMALARKMFQRRYGGPISGIKTEEDRVRAFEVINTLNRNPVYVLDVYGRMEMGALVDAATYARRRYGTRRIMIDHAHFIIPRNHRKDAREAMDDTLMEMVELTRKIDATIFLLMHPRGSVEQSEVPTGDSIKETSSAKQLADVGLSVWRNLNNAGDKTIRKLNLKVPGARGLEVEIGGDESLAMAWKVRHDEGVTGHGILKFDSRCLRYSERPEAAAQQEDARLPHEPDNPQQLSITDPFADEQ